jgi:signal peptidase I
MLGLTHCEHISIGRIGSSTHCTDHAMSNRAKDHPTPSVMINAAFGALLLIALVAAGLYAYESFDAQTNTMSPTMNEGDYFVISKRAYNVVNPQLGDVIVFTIPKWNIRSVGRVVGLPGHRIQMIEQSLTIDGQYIVRVGRDPEYSETLPNGAKYTVRAPEMGRNEYWTPQYLVPEGHYFVLGDNRDHSADSRDMDHVGFVAKESIVGKVTWRFWDGTRQQIDASAIN